MARDGQRRLMPAVRETTDDRATRKKHLKIIQAALAAVASLTLTGCFESEACKQAKEIVGSTELEVIRLEDEYKTWSDAVDEAVKNRTGINEQDMKYRQDASWNLQMARSRLGRERSAQDQACRFGG